MTNVGKSGHSQRLQFIGWTEKYAQEPLRKNGAVRGRLSRWMQGSKEEHEGRGREGDKGRREVRREGGRGRKEQKLHRSTIARTLVKY